MKDRVMAGVLAALTAGLAEMAAGQAVGPEFRINTYTTSRQDRPVVAADADGNFVVVWTSSGQDGSYGTVMGRRFDRLGNPRGSEFRVNAFTTSDQEGPALAAAADGRFVVTWHSFAQGDDNQYGVFGRRFDPSGAALGLADFRANSYTTNNQVRSNVAYSPAGEFVVVWESLTQDGHQYGIFGRRFDAAGGAIGSEFQVNTHTTSNQMQPVVAASNGGFVAAWESPGFDGSAAGIVARRFDAAGNPAGPEALVNTYTTGAQLAPSIAMDDSGSFVIVWTSAVGIAGQRFDAAGSRLGSEFIVNTYLSGGPAFPSIAMDPDGEFLVAWESVQDGSSRGVFAQRFNAGGGRVGSEFRVNTYTTSTQGYPTVASLGPSKFVVTWRSHEQDGSDGGVFGQRIGDVLFRDGFDTGNLARWSANAADGGDLGVTLDAAMKSTTFGLQAHVDDTNGLYVQDETPRDETIYRARFYFHPGDFDPGESQNHRRTRIFIAFEENPNRRLFALVLRRVDGQYSVMGRARRDDDSQANSVFVPISADAHVIEFRWARATSPDALDGVFELWIDGALQASNTTLDNAISSVDFVRMGALSVKTGASGTLYYDEFESRRELPIGP